MAVRKGTGRKVQAKTTSAQKNRKKSPSIKKGENPKEKSRSWVVLFWLAFAIFIFGLFLFNRESIVRSIQAVQNELASSKNPGETVSEEESELEATPGSTPSSTPVSTPESQQQSPPPQPVTQPAATEVPPPPSANTGSQTETGQPPSQTPQPAQNTQPQTGQDLQTVGAPELRDRALYFVQIDRGGSILRVKVDRRLPVSNSPLIDVIQALIAGPNVNERNRELISLIPPATQLISATIRGNTAYINFSEDFLYNTYGVEGYAGQLRQVVFTATEFPNVRDVQILIEGRRIDYLGEGVWIGSPLSREML